MLNLNRSIFQAHPFHLVSPSPWPLSLSYLWISLHSLPHSHPFNILPLESSVNVFKILKSCFWNQLINTVSNYMVSVLRIKIIHLLNRHPLIYYYISKIDSKIQMVTYMYTNVLKYILVYLEKNYPFSFKIFLCLYNEYTKIITGNLESKHINLFISVGILLKSPTFFKGLLIMLLAKLFKDYVLSKKGYILSNKVFRKYPFLYDIIITFFTALYILSLYICMDISYESLILPLVNKLKSCIKNIKTIILKMSGFGGGSSNNPDPSPSPNPSPSPDPSNPPSNTNVSQKSKGKKKNKKSKMIEKLTENEKGLLEMGEEFIRVNRACNTLSKKGGRHDTNLELIRTLRAFMDKYYKWLPSESKMKANFLEEEYKKKGLIEHSGYDIAPNVKSYWEYVKHDTKTLHKNRTTLFQIFEKNAKKLKKDNLGAPDSPKSKLFTEEFNHLKDLYSENYKMKDEFLKDQIKKSDKLDAMMKQRNIKMKGLFDRDILYK